MRRLLPYFLPALAFAQDGQLSLQGYTGLLQTPNALTAPEGTLTFLRAQQPDVRWPGFSRNEDYIVTMGYLSFVEGTMRLAEIPGGGKRDLSASGKIQLPGLPDGFPRFAIGIQDLGGAASIYRTSYAVATQRLGPVDVSLGYGRGPDRLKGTFGGVEWRATSWLDLVAEHDTRDKNVGLRLGLPQGFLPWGLEARVITAFNLDATQNRFSVGGLVRIPFDLGRPQRRLTPGPKPSQAVPGAPGAHAPRPGLIAAPATPPPDRSEGLAARLVGLGFENVRVGRLERTLVVELENNRYNHNALDGIGLALGCAADMAGAGSDRVILTLRKRGLRLLDIEAPLTELRAFFVGPDWDLPGAAYALGSKLIVRQSEGRSADPATTWSAPRANASWGHTAAFLYPGLVKTVGTEVGRFDYQASLRLGTITQLWAGAQAELGGEFPLSNSHDFGPQGLFYDRAVPNSRLDRALVTQALPLLPGLMTLFGGGRARYGVDGVFNETQWRSPEGVHRLSVHVGNYRESGQAERKVSLGSYRLSIPSLDASLEATAGTFFNRDKGFRLEALRWFRDVSLRVTYSDTDVKVLGFSVGIPLTPRRDFKPGYLQVRGIEQFVEGLRSVVKNDDGRNPVTFGKADVQAPLSALSHSVYDRDRLGEATLRNNLGRLREAFERWGRDSFSALKASRP